MWHVFRSSKRSFIEIFQKAKKMYVKSVVSAVALSAAMLLSGSAFAQTMFNGAELSADDLPKVTERCEQLATAASTQSATDSSTADSSSDATAGGSDATINEAPEVNEAAAATAKIDLDTVTLEQCEAAGLGGAM